MPGRGRGQHQQQADVTSLAIAAALLSAPALVVVVAEARDSQVYPVPNHDQQVDGEAEEEGSDGLLLALIWCTR